MCSGKFPVVQSAKSPSVALIVCTLNCDHLASCYCLSSPEVKQIKYINNRKFTNHSKFAPAAMSLTVFINMVSIYILFFYRYAYCFCAKMLLFSLIWPFHIETTVLSGMQL